MRGPGSVLYGTGAFSGVVNVVTRARDEPTGDEVALSAGGDGIARAHARVQERFDGDHGGVWTSLGAGHGAGNNYFFPEYVTQGPPQVAGNARGVDGFDVVTWAGGSLGLSPVQWSLNSHRKTLPTGQFDTLLGDPDTRQTDTRAMFEAKVEPKLGAELESTTRAALNYYGYRGHFAHDPTAGGLEYVLYNGQWVTGEQRFVYKPLDALRITAGGEVQRHFSVHTYDASDTQGVYDDDTHSFSLLAGYVVGDVVPARWLKVELGGRYDQYLYEAFTPAQGSRIPSFGVGAASPRVACLVKPGNADEVKLLGGQAFRPRASTSSTTRAEASW